MKCIMHVETLFHSVRAAKQKIILEKEGEENVVFQCSKLCSYCHIYSNAERLPFEEIDSEALEEPKEKDNDSRFECERGNEEAQETTEEKEDQKKSRNYNREKKLNQKFQKQLF